MRGRLNSHTLCHLSDIHGDHSFEFWYGIRQAIISIVNLYLGAMVNPADHSQLVILVKIYRSSWLVVLLRAAASICRG